jgi:hypothetical protein
MAGSSSFGGGPSSYGPASVGGGNPNAYTRSTKHVPSSYKQQVQ